VAFARWSVISRDEQFRSFDPERIAIAIAKALAAADGAGSVDAQELGAERRAVCGALCKRVCDDLVRRRPTGGTFYLEEIQDLVELALMRAGEHEAARRFVLYRENRRKARQADPSRVDADGVGDLLARLQDPLVQDSLDRFVMFPIRHRELWQAYKDHLALMWTAEEIDLAKDQLDWRKLNDDERHFLTHVLAFFSASDGIVNENLAARFYREVKAPEARAYYSMQMLIETIHSETYSLLIDTYITNEDEKRRVLRAVETMPIVERKARWALDWLASERPLAERLVAFACVEGIFFSSSFCSIYWLKDTKGGMLPGLCFSNELISRDEGLHTDFAVTLHRQLQDRASPARIRQMVEEAVAIECEFATEALPVSLIGMNAAAMQQYVRFVADRLLTQLGCERAFGARCPFDFMERLGLQNKTNFHEKKVAEYRKAGIGHSLAELTIAFDGDF
jgi:ribonucleotide reductase beta subunit family protein with ferritin-like domain